MITLASIPKHVSREYSTAVDSKNTVAFLYLNKETCWQVWRFHPDLMTQF